MCENVMFLWNNVVCKTHFSFTNEGVEGKSCSLNCNIPFCSFALFSDFSFDMPGLLAVLWLPLYR